MVIKKNWFPNKKRQKTSRYTDIQSGSDFACLLWAKFAKQHNFNKILGEMHLAKVIQLCNTFLELEFVYQTRVPSSSRGTPSNRTHIAWNSEFAKLDFELELGSQVPKMCYLTK